MITLRNFCVWKFLYFIAFIVLYYSWIVFISINRKHDVSAYRVPNSTMAFVALEEVESSECKIIFQLVYRHSQQKSGYSKRHTSISRTTHSKQSVKAGGWGVTCRGLFVTLSSSHQVSGSREHFGQTQIESGTILRSVWSLNYSGLCWALSHMVSPISYFKITKLFK